jgi:hypothetical protein
MKALSCQVALKYQLAALFLVFFPLKSSQWQKQADGVDHPQCLTGWDQETVQDQDQDQDLDHHFGNKKPSRVTVTEIAFKINFSTSIYYQYLDSQRAVN